MLPFSITYSRTLPFSIHVTSLSITYSHTLPLSIHVTSDLSITYSLSLSLSLHVTFLNNLFTHITFLNTCYLRSLHNLLTYITRYIQNHTHYVSQWCATSLNNLHTRAQINYLSGWWLHWLPPCPGLWADSADWPFLALLLELLAAVSTECFASASWQQLH